MDRASAAETVDSASVPVRVKPKIWKIGIHNFPTGRPAIKKDSVKESLFVVGRWQLDSKTEGSLRCLLSKATW